MDFRPPDVDRANRPLVLLCALLSQIALFGIMGCSSHPRGAKEVGVAFEGTWVAESMIHDGKIAWPTEVAKIRLSFDVDNHTSGRFILELPSVVYRGSYSKWVSTSVNLESTLDCVLSTRENLNAIWKTEEPPQRADKLTICFGEVNTPRPRDFTAEKGSKQTLLVFTREAEKAAPGTR